MGVLSIEAIIALLAFAALLSVSVSSQQLMLAESSENSDAFTARLQAFKCAVIADAMFSNTVLEIKGKGFECFAKENKTVGVRNGIEEEIETIAEIQELQGKKVLEIELNEHYK